MTNKITYNKVSNIIITILALVALIYVSLVYVSLHGIGLIYQSDIISIPYLYRDLFYHGGMLSQWLFPPTMCFFPDVVVYFILAAIFGNLKLAIVLFAVYQFLLYYVLIVVIGYRLTKNMSLFSISVLSTFFFYSAGMLQQNMFYAPALSGHFGTALMYLLGCLLIIDSFSSKNKFNYILLGGIYFLTIFSDLLYLTQFIAPAFATLFVMLWFLEKEKVKVCVTHMTIMGVVSILAYIVFRKAKSFFHWHIMYDNAYDNVLRRHHLSDLILASKTIIAKLQIFYQTNSVIMFALFIFTGVTVVYVVRLLYRCITSNKISNEEAPFIFMILMLLASILLGYCSLIFLDNNLVSSDPSLRHFQTFVLFPVFLGIPLYLARYSNLGVVVTKYYKAILVSMVICVFMFSASGSVATLVNYYPPQVACIDQYAQQYKLTYGVGQYWDAKIYSFLSKQGITIATVDSVNHLIMPSLGYVTINDYLNKSFNFVVVDNTPNSPLVPADIIRTYGEPLKILQCPDPEQNPLSIYLYKNGVINATWTKKELTL